MDGPNTPLKLSGVHGIYYALSDNAMIRRVPSLIFHQEDKGLLWGLDAQEESKFTWSATENEGLT